MFSTRNITIAVAVAVALALTSVITRHYDARQADSLRESLAAARSLVRAEVRRADEADARAKQHELRAVAAEARSDSLSLTSRRAQQSARAAWHQFDSLSAQNVCDSSCIAVALNARAADSVAIADAHAANDELRSANARLKLGLDDTRQALASLRSSAVELEAVSAKALPRRSLLSRLLPQVGPGAAVGLDLAGKPNLVTGVTLSWSL